ncbi:hypothetical protein CYFUS_001754 [Cystobacter fuscus]|uniref:Uncharacterized protein n=1 Tax=Cystobacter fuscus TaxID=43 RepID=A0A250IYK3_9BACT|nr:hypothetical protein [Cystobacter fuscus]ATB36340.1 hypothetical protein CYFUS_001754 [Cystobacter fuscus]
MMKLALLGDSYPSQVRVNPRALGELDVVWVGQSRETFFREVPRLRPQVLALDFMDLTQVPTELIPGMLESTGARHALISYRLPHAPLIDALRSPRVSFLRGPVPLSLLHLRVHQSLDDLKRAGMPPSQGPAGRAPRFSPEQLGRLMELSTQEGCECASQLARLVGGLRGFREYTAGCEPHDEKDQRLHELLDRQMARAREALEEGLVALLEHEHIRL